MGLTDTAVKNAKHKGTAAGNKLSDGQGLYLLVKATGKYWRMDYRFADKRKTLALGIYGDVSLAQARKRRDAARQLLADGTDPGLAKKLAAKAKVAAAANTFELVAREFHQTKLDAWSASYAEKWLRLIAKDLFPYLGSLPLPTITAPLLLDAIRRVEKRGKHETAHTLRQSAGQVFRYGVQTGRCDRNPALDLHGALKPVVTKHHAAILEPTELAGLLRAIHGYTGQITTRVALVLSALLFQRPGNIRAMEWAWIDFDRAMLTIPSADMKRRVHQKLNGRPHLVPLARQALQQLQEIKPLTGRGRYVFPGLRSNTRPMSDATVRAALQRMGYDQETMSAHGFRASARTILIEQFPGISADVIEAQLAHGKSGPLGMAYDRAEFVTQRVAMMQVWADYLDTLRTGAQVIQFQAAA